LQSRVAGASGNSSIAWSQGRLAGSHWDAFSLNTLPNLWYLVGMTSFQCRLVVSACAAASAVDLVVCHMAGSKLMNWDCNISFI
jgi:hypothetical protein